MSHAAITSSEFLDPHTLAKLNGLELRAARIVEGYVAGLHRSPFQGFSNEFAEHREYTPGDDLRYVDWKVFGRDQSHLLFAARYQREYAVSRADGTAFEAGVWTVCGGGARISRAPSARQREPGDV
jgi:hypothetical protein